MHFNGNMLRLARQIRNMSQGEIVDSLNGEITQGTLSKIERGRIQPDMNMVEAFAKCLRVHSNFFYEDGYLRQPPVSYHRKRSKLKVSDREAIHGLSEVLRLSLKKCLESVEYDHEGPKLPSFDLDQFSGDAREAARLVRNALKLPRGPINNLSALAEKSGVIVCRFNFGSDLIDGFCQHSDGTLPPIIFINSALPVDRMRFSLAHEIGHLVCHDVPNPEQEIQANQFASEFLMPVEDIYDDLRDFNLNKAMELKMYWGTSMQSLINKAWDVGRIGDKKRTSYFIEMSRRGWRKTEPVEASHFFERPSVLEGILRAHTEELGYTNEDLSEMFGLYPSELNKLFPIASRPKLRVVAAN